MPAPASEKGAGEPKLVGVHPGDACTPPTGVAPAGVAGSVRSAAARVSAAMPERRGLGSDLGRGSWSLRRSTGA
eukprot:scaffold3960_cov116-Isochrysis_galbana.AAC.4